MAKKNKDEFKLWHTPFYIVGVALAGVFYTGVFAYKRQSGLSPSMPINKTLFVSLKKGK